MFQNLEVLHLSNNFKPNLITLENNNISDGGGLALDEALIANQSLQLINLCNYSYHFNQNLDGNHLSSLSVEKLIQTILQK